MPGNKQASTVISFGPFEADLHTQELRKQGVRLRLPGQSFQILEMLLKRAGKLVTREELQQALWPSETHVDFERGVNAAVNRLREVMGDSADSPHLIETLPRRGYRFIGSIDAPPKPDYSWLRFAALILAASVCVLAVGFLYLKTRHVTNVEESIQPVPLTAYPGFELFPAFSPDGSQVVFSWSGDSVAAPKNMDLYVKVIGTENLLRLTHQSDSAYPAWSPDGAQIAFVRVSGKETGIYVIPALGGPERKLITTRDPVYIRGPIHWSPDSKWITYSKVDPAAGPHFLYLLSIETLESKPIIPHGEGCLYAGGTIFSHSGEQLAYFCFLKVRDNEFGIYTVRLSGGPPTLVTRFGTGWGFERGMAWTADDKKLIFARSRRGNDYELDEVTLADGTVRTLYSGQNGTWWPSISDKGDKLVYSLYSAHVDIWRKDLLHPEAAAVKLNSSTHDQFGPEYSPDGKHIAFVSNRSGFFEIWMSDADGTHLVRMSDSRTSGAGTPRWSPDSQKIAFDSRVSGTAEVYIVDLAERLPRKVMTNLPSMSTPYWSHDGKWLYFESSTADKSDSRIYRCPATGGDAMAISAASGSFPFEAFDGQTVYFAGDGPNGRTILVASLTTPANQSVLNGMPAIGNHSCWTVVPKGIYFVPATDDSSIHYFDFKTRQVRQVFKAGKSFENGVSVSPDGRWFLYTQIEENSDLMLVDHFR